MPLPLLYASVTVCVLPGLVDSPNSDAEAVFGTPSESLGMLQKIFVLIMQRKNDKNEQECT